AEVGFFVDDERHLSLELAGMIVLPVQVDFATRSDGAGNPVITRPVFNPVLNREAAFIDALPGVAVGSATINAWSELYGGEVNAPWHPCMGGKLPVQGPRGLRILRLQAAPAIQGSVHPPGASHFPLH